MNLNYIDQNIIREKKIIYGDQKYKIQNRKTKTNLKKSKYEYLILFFKKILKIN